MSNRFLNLVVLASMTGIAAGFASEGSAMQAAGLLPGLADGFLIMFDLFTGELAGANPLTLLPEASSYSVGYLSGATAFFAAGTACSLP
jgi:hypothetical protein